MQKKIFNKTIFHLIFIAVISLIAYSNTFEASFHFDDDHYIIKNSGIRDLNNFIQVLSSADFDLPYKRTFKSRYIGFLTFALNYRIHGLNVAGYHYVNLFIHICTSLLLYFFILLTFKTPSLRSSAIRDKAGYIALFSALLFACHPLQTQAVTYIWQRVTSLCTMFYLLSLVAYIKWRISNQSALDSPQMTENRKKGGGWLFYALSIISAILAMKTKEIAFMLPVMLTLYEMIFFKGKMKKRVLYLMPFIMIMLIIPLTLLNIDKPIGDIIGNLDERIKNNADFSRGEYLLAEFRVLVTYLRLIFLPINQNLDYDYPRYYSFFQAEVISSFVFLSFIFGLSVYMLIRYRDSDPHSRLISFSIIWFFINLIVESSIIPLDNVIFEHRMYLPSVGVFSALTIATFMLINRWKAYAKVITVMLVVIIMVLTGATYARNAVWKDGITLWQNVVNNSPNKARGYIILGNGYRDKGITDRAIENYRRSIELDPYYPEAYTNLGLVYQSHGLIDNAITQYNIALKVNPDFSYAHKHIGFAYFLKRDTGKAIYHLKRAVDLLPGDAKIHLNLGIAYKSQGLIEKANKHFSVARKFNPRLFRTKNTQH